MNNNNLSEGDVLAAVSGTTTMTSRISSTSPPPLFPFKLHFVLEEAARNGQEDIISWMPFGTSFKVHNKEEFERQILPTYFNTTKFKSFQRSLNLWGFHAFTKGPSKGASHHPLFRRGRPELCKGMTRDRIKRTSSNTEKTTAPTTIGQIMMHQEPTAAFPPSPSPTSLPALLPPYLPLTGGQLGSMLNKYKTATVDNKNNSILAPRQRSSDILPLANLYAAKAPSLFAGTIRSMIAGGGDTSSPHQFVVGPNPTTTTTTCLGSKGVLGPHQTFENRAAQTLLLEELLRGTLATVGCATRQPSTLTAAFFDKASAAATGTSSLFQDSRLVAEKEQQARQLLAFAASAIDKAANIC